MIEFAARREDGIRGPALEVAWEGLEKLLGAPIDENLWDLLFYNRVGASVGAQGCKEGGLTVQQRLRRVRAAFGSRRWRVLKSILDCFLD